MLLEYLKRIKFKYSIKERLYKENDYFLPSTTHSFKLGEEVEEGEEEKVLDMVDIQQKAHFRHPNYHKYPHFVTPCV